MTALLLLFRGEIPTLSFTFLAKNWATEGLSLVLMEPARLEEEPAGAGEEEPAAAGAGEEEPAAAGAGEEEESDEGSCCAKQTKRSLICLARGNVFWSA
jgi:hypothetical protein